MSNRPNQPSYSAEEAAYLKAARAHLAEIRTLIPDAELFSVELAEQLHRRGRITMNDIRQAVRPDDPPTTVIVWSEARGRLERVDMGKRHRPQQP
jgi:hypothetical protein